jgi:predicted DCC family thiol-disulfide oxidoreductase YuxK
VSNPEKPILLFDGVCNLCNAIVSFTLKRDRGSIFLFASLQSRSGREILDRFGLPKEDFDSYLLVMGGKCFSKSTAGLLTLKMLGWPWKAAYALILIPRPVRDAVYDLIARNRYRVFGRTAECMIPTPEIKARFLP